MCITGSHLLNKEENKIEFDTDYRVESHTDNAQKYRSTSKDLPTVKGDSSAKVISRKPGTRGKLESTKPGQSILNEKSKLKSPYGQNGRYQKGQSPYDQKNGKTKTTVTGKGYTDDQSGKYPDRGQGMHGSYGRPYSASDETKMPERDSNMPERTPTGKQFYDSNQRVSVTLKLFSILTIKYLPIG